MVFRDGKKGSFPRKGASESEIAAAKERDREKKFQNELSINKSKYRMESNFMVGDTVLLRNNNRARGSSAVFNP